MVRTGKIFYSYAMCAIAGAMFGFIVFGGKVMELCGFSLIEVLMYPNLMCIAIFALRRATWAGRGRGGIADFYRQPLAATFGYTLMCIMANVGQYAPLFMGVSVSLVLFLMYLQPVWTIISSAIFLGEKFTRANGAACMAAIAGLVLLLAPWRGAEYSIPGVILALMGGMGLSGWVLMNSYFSKKGISPAIQAMIMNINQAAPFIIAWPLIAAILPDPAVSEIAWRGAAPLLCVFAFAFLVYIVGHTLFYRAERRISATHAGLIILLEPVVGTALDIIALGSPFGWNMAAGGGLILGVNAWIILANKND